MATYKLIQDIEAEDHILGPLTLRQFIYGLVAAFLYYMCFIMITKHVLVLLIVFLPLALFASFFAFPFKRDQPTEVWALAKLRFLLKPKRRIWSQSGVKEMVTIAVPKKVERHLTKDMSEDEVRSRLKALAMTIDTRGWAVKNMQQNMPPDVAEDESDRLIDIGSLPKPVSDNVAPEEDMLDDANPQSQHINQAIEESTQERRQHLADTMNKMHYDSHPVEPLSEESISQDLKARSSVSALPMANMHTVSTEPAPATKTEPAQPSTPIIVPDTASAAQSPAPVQTDKHVDPAILNFALNNHGISVQTIANEANKSDEVVIKLR